MYQKRGELAKMDQRGLTVVSTVYLLTAAQKVARRRRQGLKWRGVTTTILVAVVYCIAVLSYMILRFGEPLVDDQNTFFHNDFPRITKSCFYLNTISNFYIYCLTVPSFRKFLCSRIKMMIPVMSNSAVGAVNENRPTDPTDK